MLRVISEVKPTWVIGENVAGILTMENGKTFEEICASLENEGYEVQSYLIPACGIGAWHRRERIWIVANNSSFRCNNRSNNREKGPVQNNVNGDAEKNKPKRDRRERGIGEISKTGNVPDPYNMGESSGLGEVQGEDEKISQRNKNAKLGDTGKFNATNPDSQRRCSRNPTGKNAANVEESSQSTGIWTWDSEPELGRVAHGIPNRVDRLKGLGNAIVPQVAYEIFKAIYIHSKLIYY